MYLDRAVTRAIAGHHAAAAALFVGRVDASARSLWGAAGFLDAALDIVGIVRAIAGEVEASSHAVGGGLAGACSILFDIVSGLWLFETIDVYGRVPEYCRQSQLSVRKAVEVSAR